MNSDSTLAAPSISSVSSANLHEESPGYLQRLFVGYVPKHFTEKDLLPVFNRHGVVRDCIVLKDKVTGQPRGAAFVSYGTREEAEAAIQGLNRQVHLPGALAPLEVRFAKNNQFVQASEGPSDNRQLFFSGAPRSLGEGELVSLFSSWGSVEEVNLFRDRKTGASKGSGFVTMATREQAANVLHLLGSTSHQAGGVLSPSSPAAGLQVKWADPDLQHKKKVAVEKNNAENRMLFFARVTRSASEEEVKAVFSQYGTVYDVILFRAFQGAPTSRGCGLVTMGSHEEAAAALEGLDNKFVWGGMGSPMSVRWMDAALQKRRRDAHVAAVRHDLLPPIRLTAAPLLSPQSLPLTRAGLQQGAALNTGLLRGLSAPTAAFNWLHQPEMPLSVNLAGPAGYAALSAPAFPLARQDDELAMFTSGGQPQPQQALTFVVHQQQQGRQLSSQLWPPSASITPQQGGLMRLMGDTFLL